MLQDLSLPPPHPPSWHVHVASVCLPPLPGWASVLAMLACINSASSLLQTASIETVANNEYGGTEGSSCPCRLLGYSPLRYYTVIWQLLWQ